MPMRKFIFQKLVFLLSVVFCLTSLFVTVKAESWSWIKVADNVNLQSVDMVNSNDGWAVGSEGTIVHWDGLRWNNIDSHTAANLRAVDVISSNDAYAIAFAVTIPINKSIIRWDGVNWKNVTTPPSYLRSIDMVSSSDGWAVGHGGLIIRWDGKNWTRIETPTNTPLESISVISATDAWAVGSNKYNSGIFHWNGIEWSIAESPEVVGTRTLWSVDMVSSSDGWAVGEGGIIIHWDGTCWRNIASPTSAWLSCVDMVNSTDVWIVGADGVYHWQENAGFPVEYLIILITVVVAVAVAWFLIRKRNSRARI